MTGISLQDGRPPKSLACIDRQSDIEACGGCPFAAADSVQGDDCTEMQGVDEVIVSGRLALNATVFDAVALSLV